MLKSWWWKHRFGIAVCTILVLMQTPQDWLCLVVAFTVVGLDLVFDRPKDFR